MLDSRRRLFTNKCLRISLPKLISGEFFSNFNGLLKKKQLCPDDCHLKIKLTVLFIRGIIYFERAILYDTIGRPVVISQL